MHFLRRVYEIALEHLLSGSNQIKGTRGKKLPFILLPTPDNYNFLHCPCLLLPQLRCSRGCRLGGGWLLLLPSSCRFLLAGCGGGCFLLTDAGLDSQCRLCLLFTSEPGLDRCGFPLVLGGSGHLQHAPRFPLGGCRGLLGLRRRERHHDLLLGRSLLPLLTGLVVVLHDNLQSLRRGSDRGFLLVIVRFAGLGQDLLRRLRRSNTLFALLQLLLLLGLLRRSGGFRRRFDAPLGSELVLPLAGCARGRLAHLGALALLL
mmetsp:Transcript_3750/g.9493  ORF Transcript_3750/g.9493 Transcript_3750/m.9493 type:complete len:260 (-) Transcript_3750:316-1095(-)